MHTSFLRNERGTVALIFALALIPLLAFMGAALDYTRAAASRTALQAAIDATALAVAHIPAGTSDADFQIKARSFFNSNYDGATDGALDSFSATRDNGVITVNAKGHLTTSLMGVVGVDMVNFGAAGTVQAGSKNLEVVMALDNTGSMDSSGKIQALRTAASELVDTLSAKVTKAGQLKIGLVPFATDVRVDYNDPTYADANWIDFSVTGTTTTCSSRNFDVGGATVDFASFNSDSDKAFFSLAGFGGWGGWGGGGGGGGGSRCTPTKRTWTGCIADRSSPNNTTDATVTGTSTEYPAIPACGSGENLTFVQPLTEDFSGLKQQISTMTAGGNTNITIGAIWGLSLLSPTAPFTDGADYTDTDVHKVLIVMTDGENTQDATSSSTSTMNKRTLAACTAAKNAGVEVYTIGVMTTNGSLLSSCASDSAHYLPVSNASQLTPTFIGIANTIAKLQLTS